MTRPLILVTNDDGFRSRGLWAAAEAALAIGDILVVAPRVQQTGVGRSMPSTSEGRITTERISIQGQEQMIYAVDGTPAQAVVHGLLELAPRKPDLAIAGINYGENVGTGVTISGTVGAALEAASHGIPALAVSLETAPEYYFSYSEAVDFRVAAHFTRRFAERLLSLVRPDDVDVLKIEVPGSATEATPWRVTRLSRQRYFIPVPTPRDSFDQPGPVGYRVSVEESVEPDSDVQALYYDKVVAVTPLSLDLTSRISLAELEQALDF